MVLNASRGRWAGVVVALAVMGVTGAGRAGEPTSPAHERPSVFSDIISFNFDNKPIREVVDYIRRNTGHNILVDKDVTLNVTARLNEVHWQRTLEMLLEGSGCVLEEEGINIYRISKPETVTAWGEGEDIRKVLNNIAKQSGIPIVIAPEVKGTIDYSFKDVTWKEAIETVAKTGGYAIVRDRRVLRVVAPSTLKEQLETRIYQLKYVRPPSTYTAVTKTPYAVGEPKATQIDEATGVPKNFTLYHALQKALSDHGRLEYDTESNSFIVTDTKPVLDQIRLIIDKVDVEPEQVYVDVRFVTTSRTDFLNLGVDWEKGLQAVLTPGSMVTRFPFSRGKDGVKFIENTFGLDGNGYSDADVAAFLGGKSPFTFGTLSFASATAALKVLKNDECTRVRQAPRLMILNRQTGTVFVGSSIRFAEIFSSSSQGGTLATGVREADSSPVNTGFQLLVIPHIVPGTKDILMTVIPESNSLTEFKEFGTAPNVIELPQIDSSTVVTQMLVRDNDTAVIGGLVVDRKEEQVRKVPFLGDIPLLGYVFKWKTTNKAQDHLMIFITPRIVRTPKDSQAIFAANECFDWPVEPCEPPCPDKDAPKKPAAAPEPEK